MRSGPPRHAARTPPDHAGRLRCPSPSPFERRGRRRCRRCDRRSGGLRLSRCHAPGSARRRPLHRHRRRRRIIFRMQDLSRKAAHELAALVRAREISPVEVLDAHLAVIDRLNPTLNAIVTLVADSARKDARAAEQAVTRGDKLGPLHGLPIGIKDIVATAGIRTTYGCPLYADNVPAEDAEVVRRLKAAGAIVLAKTNTPEFAAGANTVNPVFGATRNPWNTALSPAGSSGGSAAAVASGMLPIAQGTDFGCSVRIPAAFCGIVGIR